MLRFTIVLCAAALSGMCFAQSTAARIKAFDVEKAKQLIADELSDPDSAKFRKLYISEFVNAKGESYLYLCGEINAKNKMGGYVGYRQFHVDEKSGMIDPGAGNEKSQAGVQQMIFDSAHPKTCGKSVKEVK